MIRVNDMILCKSNIGPNVLLIVQSARTHYLDVRVAFTTKHFPDPTEIYTIPRESIIFNLGNKKTATKRHPEYFI